MKSIRRSCRSQVVWTLTRGRCRATRSGHLAFGGSRRQSSRQRSAGQWRGYQLRRTTRHCAAGPLAQFAPIHQGDPFPRIELSPALKASITRSAFAWGRLRRCIRSSTKRLADSDHRTDQTRRITDQPSRDFFRQADKYLAGGAFFDAGVGIKPIDQPAGGTHRACSTH